MCTRHRPTEGADSAPMPDNRRAVDDACRAIRDFARTSMGVDQAINARAYLDEITGDTATVNAYVRTARAFEVVTTQAKDEGRRLTAEERRGVAEPFAAAERALWQAVKP